MTPIASPSLKQHDVEIGISLSKLQIPGLYPADLRDNCSTINKKSVFNSVLTTG